MGKDIPLSFPKDAGGSPRTRSVDVGHLMEAIEAARARAKAGTRPSFGTRASGVAPSARDILPVFSDRMKRVLDLIEQVADTNATVLIRGESGTGKELVAQAIHYASPRSNGPFIKVNCAALPTELLESELFGHERGAFTGAYYRKPGKFEFANKGTILLDEIGDLPLPLQAKLLHVLQDSQFSRIGGHEVISIDARVIAATNIELEGAVNRGHFRKDLYYRINVINIFVPPLRERPEDIPHLAHLFLDQFNAQYGRTTTLAPETMQLLLSYPWPGNVRELENVIKRLVVIGNEQMICQERLAPATGEVGQAAEAPTPAPGAAGADSDLKAIARRAAREAERVVIWRVLEEVHGNRAEAARRLKISSKALRYKLRECGFEIEPGRFRARRTL